MQVHHWIHKNTLFKDIKFDPVLFKKNHVNLVHMFKIIVIIHQGREDIFLSRCR
jgi:hypothetical protein